MCHCCEKIILAPVPPHVIIDSGILMTSLLAHVLVAKFMDHLALYREEHNFERAGHQIVRSTLAQWVGRARCASAAELQALADELRRHVVLHADEGGGVRVSARPAAARTCATSTGWTRHRPGRARW